MLRPIQFQKQQVKQKSKFISTSRNIFMGHTWSDTTGLRFTFGGLIDLEKLKFNTVDGFVYGMDFSLTKSWKDRKQLYISPEVFYAFSREELLWRVNTYFRFDTEYQNQIYLRTGRTSTDINNTGGINSFLNSASSLLFEKNYMKLYETGYLTLGYMREIVNGLRVDIGATYEDRKVLENTTDFSYNKYRQRIYR